MWDQTDHFINRLRDCESLLKRAMIDELIKLSPNGDKLFDDINAYFESIGDPLP